MKKYSYFYILKARVHILIFFNTKGLLFFRRTSNLFTFQFDYEK